jgi:hypothetical protein
MKLQSNCGSPFPTPISTPPSGKASRFWHKQHDIIVGAPGAGFTNLVSMPSENIGPRFEIFQEKESASTTPVQEIMALVQHAVSDLMKGTNTNNNPGHCKRTLAITIHNTKTKPTARMMSKSM